MRVVVHMISGKEYNFIDANDVLFKENGKWVWILRNERDSVTIFNRDMVLYIESDPF